MGELSNAMQNLVDDIESSTEKRQVMTSEIRSDTHNLLERLRMEHQDMANALREKLSSDRAAHRAATQQFMSDTRSDLQDMASALKEKLSSDRAIYRDATQQFMSDNRSDLQDMANALREKLSSDETSRREATQQSIDDLASDRREAQNIWRGHIVDLVEEVPIEPVTEEEPEEEQPVEEAAPESVAEEEESSPDDRVLEVIAKHPEGIRLVDIGNEMGVDWRGLIATVKPLVDEDRVEKIDNLYYPKT